MYTKIVVDNKQPSTTTDSSEMLSKDLENKLTLNGNKNQQDSSIPLSDEVCYRRQSACSSDCDEEPYHLIKCVRNPKRKMEKVASIDIPLGLEEEPMEPPINFHQGRRSTLTVTDLPLRPALLPLAEPHNLPDSPTIEMHVSQITIPSPVSVPCRVLLEERVVEIPDDRPASFSSSRRESAQSCISDFQGSDCSGVRFVRTPSVVVSDYSDDLMCGITVEEIEYFRAQRLQRRFSMETSNTEKDEGTSDVGASSSCSDLYYCGSKNPLDGAESFVNGIRKPIDRSISETPAYET